VRTSSIGIDLIAQFEGFPNGGRPYNDPVGFATVGFGHLIARRRVTEADRRATWLPGQQRPGVLTLAEAKRLLGRDLASREQGVARLVKVPLTQGQFDALSSFVFNLGEGAFASSTLLRRLNQRDYAGAADAFLAWNKAGNPPRVLEGLTRRRKAERARFLAGGPTTVQAADSGPFTPNESRWIAEYDGLTASRRDPHRRKALRRAMTLQRKTIWRRAQPATVGGDGLGWQHSNRRGRYEALLRRTRP
jgi:lysozyme